MKPIIYLSFFFISLFNIANAQVKLKDTIKAPNNNVFILEIEKVPEFPGGVNAFRKYIAKNLKYPEVAQLIGIDGKVVMLFTINEEGKVESTKPLNCIGAACESEAENVLLNSPIWKPGIQKGKPVKCTYSVPINFTIEKFKVKFRDLNASNYGFIFNIKDSLYTIDEAEKIIGKSFQSDKIKIAVPFFNYNKIEKFDMPDKKEVYLIIFKKEEAQKID